MNKFFEVISTAMTKATLYVLVAILMMVADIMIFSFIIGDNSTFRLRSVLFTADMAVILSFYL